MEENVALDSKKQRKFVKSIRGIKKLIKKNEAKSESQKKDEKEKAEPHKPFSMKIKGGKIIKKKKRKERGLVYLSHIPHGFYEHQMTQYFKQFGVVTNARVIRSKRTGNSKGFAFVEFREPAVGQIVAETMNNYLMGKRLIKAAYIPPEKQKHKAFRKHWNGVHNPGSQLRLKMKKAFNADKDEDGELKRAKKLLYNLTKNKKKLSELGINYGFFAPVDVPEELINEVVKQEKTENDIDEEKSEPKKAKKSKKEHTDAKNIVKNEEAKIEKQSTATKPKKEQKDGKNLIKNEKQSTEAKTKKNNKNEKNIKPAELKGKSVEAKKVNKKLPVKVNEKQQKEKEQKLEAAGMKLPAEFIKIGEDSDDHSDSSYVFDSDEYEKVLDEDNSEESDESDESGDDEEGSDDESEEEETPTTKVKPVEAKKENVSKVDTNEKSAVTVYNRRPAEDNLKKLVEDIITAKLMEGDASDETYSPDPVEYEMSNHPDIFFDSDDDDSVNSIPISDDDVSEEEEESEEEEVQNPIAKAVPTNMQTRKRARNQQLQITQGKKQEKKKPPVEAKRKSPQQPAVPPKKPKFAKQNKKKPMKKQLRSK